MVAAYWPLLVLRVVAGLGAGLVVAVCYVVLGQSKQVDRNFSLYLLCQGLFSAIILKALPSLARAIGVAGIFALLAALYAVALALCRFLPPGRYASGARISGARPSFAAWTGLGAVLAFFIAQGAVWAYLELIGVRSGVDASSVATGLALSTLVGMSGPLAAAILGSRFGRALPLLAGSCMALIALALLSSSMDAIRFALAACLFNIAWNFSIPYQLSALAAVDSTGSVVGWAASASFAGLAIGPPIAAVALDAEGSVGVLWLSAGLCVLSLSGFVPALSKNVPITH
jgi:predicted MFS family arabinose efflux permease